MKVQIRKILLLAILVAVAVSGAYLVARSDGAQEFVTRFGYGGIVALAYFSGLNIIIPVPPETFTPALLASGLPAAGIVVSLVIGTTLADLTAYFIAWYGGKGLDLSKFRFFTFIDDLQKKNTAYALVVLFLWASVVPLPNELIIVPLGLIGFRLRILFIPFLLGNIIHHTWVTYGIKAVVPFL